MISLLASVACEVGEPSGPRQHHDEIMGIDARDGGPVLADAGITPSDPDASTSDDASPHMPRADAGQPVDDAAVALDAGSLPVDPPPEAVEGKAVMERSCLVCHDAMHMALNLRADNGKSLDEGRVAASSTAILARLNSADRPMPPAVVSGRLAISSDERAKVIAYVEWLLAN